MIIQNSELDREISALNELLKDRIITRKTYDRQVQALKTQYQTPQKNRQCPICLRDEGKKIWGDFKRYEDPRNKRGVHYFCKKHEDQEMPEFCGRCHHPLIKMTYNYYCYECGKLRPLEKKEKKNKIVGEKSKKIVKPKKISLAKEEPFEIKLLKSLKSKPMTRSELVDELKKARTTIYDNLRKLKVKGLIDSESRKLSSGPGRPKTYWKIVDEKAVDDYISRALINEKPKRKEKRVPCPNDPNCRYYDGKNCFSLIGFGVTLCGDSPPKYKKYNKKTTKNEAQKNE